MTDVKKKKKKSNSSTFAVKTHVEIDGRVKAGLSKNEARLRLNLNFDL